MAITDRIRTLFSRKPPALESLQGHAEPESAQSVNILGSQQRIDWDRRERHIQFQRMQNEFPTIVASLGRYTDYVKSSGWSFQPATDDDASIDIAERMTQLILEHARHEFEYLTVQTAFALHLGSANVEWSIYETDNGYAFNRARTIPLYTIESYVKDKATGDVVEFKQRQLGYPEPVIIPRWKTVRLVATPTMIHTTEGEGTFHRLLRPVQKLRNLEKLEEFAFKRDLQGIVHQKIALRKIRDDINAQHPKLVDSAKAGNKQAQEELEKLYKQKWKQAAEPGKEFAKALNDNKFTIVLTEESEPHIVRGTDNTERASTVPMSETSLLEASAGPHDILLDKIDRAKHDIQSVFETTDISLGSGRVGTQALAQTKSNIYEIRMNAVLNAVAHAIQSDLVIPIAVINGIPEDQIPTLVPQVVTLPDAETAANVIDTLVRSGMTAPNGWKGFNSVLAMYNLPVITQDEIDQAEQERMEDREMQMRVMEASINNGGSDNA